MVNSTHLFLAFLEGLGLIVSPCILPILPIMFATGLSGTEQKPYGLILGFILSFCAFTLFARALLLSTGINLDWIRSLSFILLVLIAVVLISNRLSELFARLTQKMASLGVSWFHSSSKQTGFFSGFLTGIPIGLIWTPCAGPIIAAVILQTIRAETNIESILTLLVFSLGLSFPLLLLLLFGKQVLTKNKILRAQAQNLRKILGAVLLLSVLLSMQGLFILPEQLVTTQVKELQGKGLIGGIKPYPAPELKGLSAWINSPELKLGSLKGKVVLVDFWTYSCINCIRTLAYLNSWYQEYGLKGLVIIGIHSPEFAFEQNPHNVRQAVEKYKIAYPVALDNQLQTWDNFANHYWPAHYLINKEGKVVYTHFGEGAYEITEHNIQVLLGLKFKPKQGTEQPKQTHYYGVTPETYLGTARRTSLANLKLKEQSEYQFPGMLQQNEWALQGQWQSKEHCLRSLHSKASILLHFHAQRVFIVLGSNNDQPKFANILLNGKPISPSSAGKDVQRHRIKVKEPGLYELVHLSQVSNGILEIQADSEGLEAYVFTFG